MTDYTITKQNLNTVFDEFSDKLKTQAAILLEEQSQDIGKWGMSQLWRVWMESTCKWMNAQGSRMTVISPDGSTKCQRRMTPEDCHLLFTTYWLGTDKDGNRLSWSKKGRDGRRAADKGERFHALVQHEEWAINRGIVLMKPRDSEYAKLEQEQNS